MWGCTKCGRTVEDTLDFCWNCGAPHAAAEASPPEVKAGKQNEARAV